MQKHLPISVLTLFLSVMFIAMLGSCTSATAEGSNKDEGTNKMEPASVGTVVLVDPDQLEDLMRSGDILLLDVRTTEEFKAGHLEGAEHYDISAPDFEERITALGTGKSVAVYCAMGGRSARAGEVLRSKGLKQVHDLAGGIMAWQQQGLPVVR